MKDGKRIIEINGVKMEVDLSTAKRVDEFRIGDPVKVLMKDYHGYKSYAGIIIGFDNFKALPTIVIAYLDINNYASEGLQFAYYNAKTEGVEICAADPHDIPFDKSRVMERMQRSIDKAKQEVLDLERKREIFLQRFGAYFKAEEEAFASADAVAEDNQD